MDHVLERVARKKAYNFLDRFLGYNQVSISPSYQHKIAFAMEWGLNNAPATIQRMTLRRICETF